jgi:hypothetical protein
MPQGIVKPVSQIIASGKPLIVEMEVGATATPAKMLPGILVIFDTVDMTVKEAGAKADNVVGFLEVAPDKKITDAFAVADQVKVVMTDCVAMLTLLAAENVTRGDALVSAADGKVAKQAVGAMGAQGSVIGWALESSNVTVDATILVHFHKGAEPAAAS